MKKKQTILGVIVLMACSAGVQAQKQAKDSTVNRTVVVEQQYNPDILDASKVNVLPKVAPPAVSKKAVEYDATLLPANEIPAGTLQAYTGKETQPKAQPGYARLGYGINGRLDARANYLFLLSNRDKLNLTLHTQGMDGQLDIPESNQKWDSYYYRTHTGLDYTHAFRQIDLNVAGNFGLSNFNFLPENVQHKQKFLSGDVHVGVKSTSEKLPLQFYAETNLMLYQRQHDLAASDLQEGIVRTKAGATGTISETQHIGIALAMDNVFYKNVPYKNYTSLDLNPHYLYDTEDWKIRLGAHLDIAFGTDKGFRIAPDITAQYLFSDSYLLYAQGTGGRRTNDFRRLEILCPYGELMNQPDATYEQLNAVLGFKASPTAGLWFNLYGGYQDLKNDLVQMAESSFLSFEGINTHNVYAGAEVQYDYKDFFSFTASGIYRSWETNSEKEYSLYLKPAFEANLHIGFRPIPSVLVNAGYQHITREKMKKGSASAVSDLHLGGSYEVFNGISIYARVHNLLNKKYQYYWGYPTEGTSFAGGVSFRF